MKTISVGTKKGGVGKTTMLFNIAGVLAETHRVLIVDVDPQCNLTSACGLDKSDLKRRSSRDIFLEQEEIAPKELVVKNSIPQLPNLDLIPCHELMTAMEFFLVNQPARETILRNYIHEHREFFDQYDYVMFDTNPSLGIINQNAFAASDSIFMVTDVGEDGINGAEDILKYWGVVQRALRLEPNVKALIINKADSRTKLSKEFVEFCQEDELLGRLLVEPVIPTQIIFPDARMEHQPVNVVQFKDYRKRNSAAEASAQIKALVAALREKEVF